ncbi:MAG: DNA recombination protein RmuC [Deltaproteobacteria bacterium]|nr:DNA recombination protein RmuC [Deltaproteobacteria bacterium]
MELSVAIIVLLGFLILAVIWLVVSLKGKNDGNVRAMEFAQKEAESLRHELNESITRNMGLVGQQFSQTSTQVNEQLGRITEQVNKQLGGITNQFQTSTGQINERMDNAAKVVGDVSKKLGELGKATEQLFSVGKDIASLQEILRAPKLRGELGEFFLGDLLEQILPRANFSLQHTFKSGTRVDAIIKLSEGIVPVDSKFPLENFRRIVGAHDSTEKKAAKRKFIKDVKTRIDEIADNYILPDEGTFNFALMYIPAENVYYETIIKDEEFGDESQISTYAFSKRVVPVSPNSFYAYLQTILLGLRGLEISKQAKEILSHLEGLSNDYDKFTSDFDVLGKHITNTRSKYEDAQKKADRFGEKLSRVSSSSKGELEEDSDTSKTLSK